MAMVVFDSWLYGMAFCPSVFKLSFWFLFASLFDGCLRWWGRFWWPWGKFIFYSALSSIGSVLLTQRHQLTFCLLPLVGAFVGEVDFGDLEAILFFTVRFLQLGRFCWPKGTNFSFCPHLDEVDFVDLEVPILFLQCAFFDGVDFDDPEAPIWFLSSFLVKPILLTSRYQFISCRVLGIQSSPGNVLGIQSSRVMYWGYRVAR